MSCTADELQLVDEWRNATEGERYEFKEAKTRYDFEKLCKYASALSNEGGGTIVLGITDERPRCVCGTRAFDQPERTRKGLNERTKIRTLVQVIDHPDGRVLAFAVPKHKIGLPTADGAGQAWMRDDDSLVPLSEERRQQIYDERREDFTAEICPDVTFADLSSVAIAAFREEWRRDIEDSEKPDDKDTLRMLSTVSDEQLLEDAGALIDGKPTNAAVILFAPEKVLKRRFVNAEVIFEYRSSEVPGPAADRENFREGFFLYYDRIWPRINQRNDLQQYQDGLSVRDLPTFSERPVRELIQNAVSHRDYQDGSSVLVKQYARRIMVESPGGFPPTVTVENVLRKTKARNRTITDLFEKCGLVERAGQGVDLMFTSSIQHAKQTPSFRDTDATSVVVTLFGEVQDGEFVRFLKNLDDETTRQLGTDEFLVLDKVRRDDTENFDDREKAAARRLIDLDLVERTGRNRGTRYILCRRLYQALGKTGEYTRTKGLDMEQNIQLLLKHLRDAETEGAPLHELCDVLPNLSKEQVRYRLGLLRDRGEAVVYGRGSSGNWYATAFGPKWSE